MPGYILHLAEARMIIENLENHGYFLSPEWKNRFQLGCLLPDTKKKREKVTSHFWNREHMDRQAIAPDLSIFQAKYGPQIHGPLMLGYRTHLMLDALFVNEFWNQVLEFQNKDGRREELAADIQYVLLKNSGEKVLKERFFTEEYYYGDYSRMNGPIQRKYAITIPSYEDGLTCPVEEVEMEDLHRILADLEGLVQRSPAAEKEPLRVFRQEDLEAFLRTSAGEAADYIRDHLYLLALDLDGTLLRSDKSLSAYSREVLCRTIAEGHQVLIASGRPYGALPENLLNLPGIFYAITSNGVSTYNLCSGERIFHNPMDPGAAEQVLELAEEWGATVEILYDGEAYAPRYFIEDPMKYGVNEHGVSYIQTTRIPVDDIAAFARNHLQELDAIDLMTPDPAIRQQYLEGLARIPHLYITSSLPRLVEISAEGAGKGSGLRQLANQLGHKREQSIAFGNEENDLDLFAAAGCGVAVGNSPDHVKAEADQVIGSNDEDGVAKFLEEVIK